MTVDEPQDRRESSVMVFAISFLIVAIIVVIAWWFVTEWIIETVAGGNLAKAQQFADTFGAVNALFSALAFAGVILAIVMQRQELKLQRQELRATLEEIKKSREAQEKSEQALSKQAQSLLDAAYLNALNSLQSVYQSLDDTSDHYFVTPKARIQALIETVVIRLEVTQGIAHKSRVREAGLSLIEHLRMFEERIIQYQAPYSVSYDTVSRLAAFVSTITSDEQPVPLEPFSEEQRSSFEYIVHLASELKSCFDEGGTVPVDNAQRHSQAQAELCLRLHEWLIDAAKRMQLLSDK